MRFQKKKIKVKVDAEKGNKAAGYVEKEITAHCHGGLAYHKALGGKSGFSVTHLASGLTIDPGNSSMVLDTEELAKEYIRFAKTLGVDWESDLDWKEWWNKVQLEVQDPPPPLNTIRQQWFDWWDKETRRRREKKTVPKEDMPILQFLVED